LNIKLFKNKSFINLNKLWTLKPQDHKTLLNQELSDKVVCITSLNLKLLCKPQFNKLFNKLQFNNLSNQCNNLLFKLQFNNLPNQCNNQLFKLQSYNKFKLQFKLSFNNHKWFNKLLYQFNNLKLYINNHNNKFSNNQCNNLFNHNSNIFNQPLLLELFNNQCNNWSNKLQF